MNNEIEVIKKEGNAVAGFASADGFDLIQRQAKVLAASDLVPKEFKGNMANCIIGLEIAHRIGASPLAVLQNLYIVHGKPGWSSQFIIAAINSTGKFSPLRFEMSKEGNDRTCVAWANDLSTNDRLESPLVSMAMAKSEGWIDKAGSKWKTMPELMLRYRAATFFGRLYAPEILMGMQTVEEVIDVSSGSNRKESTIMDAFEVETVHETTDDPSANAELLQSLYAKVTELAKLKGETPDDMINILSGGKVSALIDMEGKSQAYIKDLILLVDGAK